MRALVVYESMFGNTEAIARAIGEGFAGHAEAAVLSTGSADTTELAGVDLLVVGAPTHAWSLPRERTWQPGAPGAPGVVPRQRLVRDWLGDLPVADGRPAAAFATRLDRPAWVTGSAARGIARRLHGRGWSPTTRPRSFVVMGAEGPLGAGELDRARAWGVELARAAAVARGSQSGARRSRR